MGIIIYRGPSMLDGREILAILTDSSNRKIGRSVKQVWIMSPAGDTFDKRMNGDDGGFCPNNLGECPFTGNRGCYVNGRPILSIDGATRRGTHRVDLEWSGKRGQVVRLCAYGDPAALPESVLRRIVGEAKVLGYTHAWKREGFQWLASVTMASVEGDASAARARGFRSFVVRPRGANVPKGSSECASVRGVKCEACNACNGTSTGLRRDISIQAHGALVSRAESAMLVQIQG